MQAAGQSHPGNAPVWSTWTDRIPSRPLCADIFADGTLRRPRLSALGYPHVEFNAAGRVSWLNFDVDTPDSFETWDRAHLPVPNAYVQNPENGHGHLLYALNVPVGVLGLSRERPIKLAADVQRGMTRRLGADPAYSNRLAKNPSSPRWRTSWYATKPYALHDLLEALDRTDVRKPGCRTETNGISRNCDLFNELRQFAYENVLAAKRAGGTLNAWRERLFSIARGINLGFGIHLSHAELRQIAKSVARWTWRHFSDERFSEIQSRRRLNASRRVAQKTAIGIDELLKLSEVRKEEVS